MQHAYAFAERVTPEQPLSKEASICSEVTLDNPSGKIWSGHISVKIWPVKRPKQNATCQTKPKATRQSTDRDHRDSQAAGKHADLEAGCSASYDTAVAQWTEHVCVPLGSTVHSLKTSFIEKPALWWPIHLGDQVTQPNTAPAIVSQ